MLRERRGALDDLQVQAGAGEGPVRRCVRRVEEGPLGSLRRAAPRRFVEATVPQPEEGGVGFATQAVQAHRAHELRVRGDETSTLLRACGWVQRGRGPGVGLRVPLGIGMGGRVGVDGGNAQWAPLCWML